MFIAHKKLETLVENGEVTFDQNQLQIILEGRVVPLIPAVHVIELIDGDDQRQWLGKTFPIEELKAQGADHEQGTLVIGDTAYTCDDGFMTAMSPAVPEAGAPSESSPGLGHEELLADYLLKNLL